MRGRVDDVGGAEEDATNLRFFMYAHGVELDTAECDEAVFTFVLETSPNRDTAHCPTSPAVYTTRYEVDSCDAGATGYVYAGKGFGVSGLDYARYYRATVSVDSGPDGGDAEASNDACYTLLNDSECTLF